MLLLLLLLLCSCFCISIMISFHQLVENDQIKILFGKVLSSPRLSPGHHDLRGPFHCHALSPLFLQRVQGSVGGRACFSKELVTSLCWLGSAEEHLPAHGTRCLPGRLAFVRLLPPPCPGTRRPVGPGPSLSGAGFASAAFLLLSGPALVPEVVTNHRCYTL